MSTVINTNLASLFAQNSLANAQNNLAVSVQRLSSGLRINSAKDDAAGLSIAQNMQGQINGVSQSIRNLSDATNLLQVADSSLSSIQDMLLRMKQLTVQGYDGSLSASQKLNIVQELKDLNNEINATAQRTSFNGISLLTSGSSLDLVNTDIKSGASLSSQAVQVNTTTGLGAYSTLNDGANTKVGGNGQNSTYWLQLDPALSPKTPGTYTLSANGSNITLTGTFNGQAQSQTVSIMDAVGNPNGGQDKTIQQQLNFNNFGIKLNVSTVVGAGATETGSQLASAIVGRSSSIVVDGKGGQISNVRLSGANPGTYQLTYGNTGSVASLSLPASLASGQTSAGQNSNVALVGGSGSGAKANVVYDANGNVTGVQIADAGTGYKAGDVLSTAAISAGTVQNATITTSQGAGATTEVANIAFHDIAAGQTMTLAGLTFTAGANGASAAQLAKAFANMTNGSVTGAGTQVINGSGSYSGVFNGWTTGAANGSSLTATSVVANVNVADLQAGAGSTSPVVLTTVQGSAGAVETADTTFVGLSAGQSFTLAGLTFTAGAAALTAQQVAQAFAGLAAGATWNGAGGTTNANDSNSDREVAKGVTAGNAALAGATGTFTAGTLTGWGTVGAIATSVNSAADTLRFTSTTTGAIADGSHLGQTLGGVPTITTTTGGQNAVTESASVVFNGIAAHTTVNLGGLMFTAGASALTKAQVAEAFAGLQNGATTGAGSGYGTYSGALNGFSTAAASGSALDTVVFTSATANANVADLANAPVATSPTFATVTQGNSTTTEVASADFSRSGVLTSGQTLTIAGLTFTTGVNGATVAQVAAAFANLNNGDTGAALNAANHSVYGTFTGTFSGWNTGAVAADSKTVTFTASTANSNVTDLAATDAGTAPTVTVTQGSGASNEVASVQFAALKPGQKFTLGGLEYTSGSSGTLASELASAFAGLTDGIGYVAANTHAGLSIGGASGSFTSGALTGWTAANAVSGGGSAMVFTASTVGNVANLTANFSGNPTVVTQTVGANFADEASNVTFSALNAGQTVTLGGLTFTAGASGATAANVAAAFGSLSSGYDAGTGVAVTEGTLTGSLSGWKTGGASPSNVVTFTRWSNAATTVTAPSIASTDTTADGQHAQNTITFASSMKAGERVTANGLTLNAYSDLTGAQVAAAFWQKVAGTYTGDTTGVGNFSGTWGSAWQNNGAVPTTAAWNIQTVATNTLNVTNVQNKALAAAQQDTVTFQDLTAGSTVTLGGLTYTAGAGGATADDVAKAFSGLDTTAGAVNATAANATNVGRGFALTAASPGMFTSGSLTTHTYITSHSATGKTDFTWYVVNAGNAISTAGAETLKAFTGVGDAGLSVGKPNVSEVTAAGGGAKQKDLVTFVDLSAGSSLTIGGLTYTAGASGATATQVAAAYGGLTGSAGGLSYTAANTAKSLTVANAGMFTSGSLGNFTTTADLNTKAVNFEWNVANITTNKLTASNITTNNTGTSIFQNVTDLAAPLAGTAPSITTVQQGGSTNSTEAATVSFGSADMAAGDSITVGGLTFTASRDGVTQAQVAQLFAGLNDGQQGSGISTQYGTFTGQLSGWNTGADSNGSVVFTSTTASSDVADLTSNVTQRKSLNALSGIVVGNLANQTGDNLLTISGMIGGRMTTQSLALSDNKANGSQTINFDSFGIQFDVDSFQAQSANEIGAALASLNSSSAVNGSTGAFKPGQIVVGQGANSALKFQSGANTDAYIQIDTINVQTGTDGVTAGTDKAMIDVGTRISGSGLGNLGALGLSDSIDTWQTAFKNAADAVDQAVEYVSTKRATYGSQMNRLSYISTNLTAQSTNLQNSRSAIMDTDFASETAKLTKGQIMQQAATAMLAQANQMPNVILSLLK